MRKKILGLLLVVTMIISLIQLPASTAKADEVTEIGFKVTYKQTDARKMADMINAYRASNGFNTDSSSPLTYDYDLEKAAMQRAAEIAVKFDLEHKRPDGKDYKQALKELGFDISPRNIFYGENILFGTEDSMELEGAFNQFCTQDDNREIMLGYFTSVGIGHIKMEEKTDFWVQIFSDEGKNYTYVAPIDGTGTAYVKVAASNVESVSIDYVSGATTVAAGSTVATPVYTAKARFVNSELKEDLPLSPVVFESNDGYVSASGGNMTGLKAGAGTISASFLGRSVSCSITVTGGSGNVTTPTQSVTQAPTAAPTQIVTQTPTAAPTQTVTQAPTTAPTQTVTQTPTTAPTQTVTQTPTTAPEPTLTPAGNSGTSLKKGSGFEEGGVLYKVTAKGKVAVVGLYSKKSTSASIPAKVTHSGYDYTVNKIAASAFKGCTKLTSITIGKNVKAIGSKAFYGCKKLKTIKFEGTSITSIGSKAFTKTYSKVKIQLPSKSADKYKKLMKKAGLSSKAVFTEN